MGAFQSNDVWMESKVSAADLTTKQWHFVKLNAEGRVVPCDTAGEKAYGVLQNKPINGGVAQVVRGPGGSDVVAGAAVAAIGAELTTNAQGRAVVASTDKHYVNGISTGKATADGNVIGANLTTYTLNK